MATLDRRFASRAIGAGFLATLLMTVLAYAAPMIGLPRMDFASMLAGLITGQPPAPWTGPWWAGMLWHFVNGTLIFPLIYAAVLYPALTGRPWIKGVIFGLILWVLSESAVAPLMGLGFFATRTLDPVRIVVGSLIGHFVYGAVLGAVTGSQAEELLAARIEEEQERRAA